MTPIEYAETVNQAVQLREYLQEQIGMMEMQKARSGFDFEIERRKRDMQALGAQRFLEAYQRSRVGNYAQSSLGGVIAASYDYVTVPAPPQRRPSGQGMTRGYWRGAVGQHPGYRLTVTA